MQNSANYSPTMDWTVPFPMHLKVHIFSCLPLRDRENVRLVCKDWYEVSWSRKLIKNDWVTLTKDELTDVTQKMKLLVKVFSAKGCGWKPCNFELGEAKLVLKVRTPFWTTLGPIITRLKITDKTVHPELLQLILERCTALESLDFGSADLKWPAKMTDASRAAVTRNLRNLRVLKLDEDHASFNLFNGLIPDNVHKSVKASMRGNEASRKSYMGHRVKEVSLTASVVALAELQPVTLPSTQLPITDLSLKLFSRNSGPPQSYKFENFATHSVTIKKLDLSVVGFLNHLVIRDILQMLQSLLTLESLTLNIDRWQAAGVVLSVLNTNSNLQELSLSCSARFRSIDFYTCPTTPSEIAICDALSGAESVSLKSLCIDQMAIEGILVWRQSLATFARSVTTLKLCHVRDLCDATLQLICKWCTCLSILVVELGGGEITDAGLTGVPNLLGGGHQSTGLSNLRNLKSLELAGHFGSATMKEIRFDRLRRLRLSGFTGSNLRQLAQSNRQLEALQIDSYRACDLRWVWRLTWDDIIRDLVDCPRLVSLSVDAPLTNAIIDAARSSFPNIKRLNDSLVVAASKK